LSGAGHPWPTRAFIGIALLTRLTSTASAAACKVILVPGAFGQGKSSLFLDSRDYFGDYEKFFQEQGCVTLKIQFPVDVTIELRARILRDTANRFIERNGGGTAVIVAHSEGGLDSRFALKALGLRNISALITIGAPNEGTPLADWVMRHRQRRSLLYWVLRVFGNYDLRTLPFVGEMTDSFLAEHAGMFAEVPGVKYASARGVCRTRCHWALRLLDWLSGGSGGLSSERGGDGVIPADRQRYGEDLGEYDLDHISEVSVDTYNYSERQRFLTRLLPYIK